MLIYNKNLTILSFFSDTYLILVTTRSLAETIMYLILLDLTSDMYEV